MAVVTICSDFGAQKNKVCHFHTLIFFILSTDPEYLYLGSTIRHV